MTTDERAIALIVCLNNDRNPTPLLRQHSGEVAARLLLVALLDARCIMTPQVALSLIDKEAPKSEG